MIKVSVLYPNGNDVTFDRDYYVTKHIPLCQQLVGEALRKVEIDEGIGGGMPGSPPPFVAAVHLYFDSLESFMNSFGPHAGKIVKDVPNYTNIKPVTQIAKVSQA